MASELVARPLNGLKVGAYYGCHIVRPPKHFGFFDSRNARSIETLNEILGCDSIDYDGRVECCGFHTAAGDEDVAIKLSGRHVKSAKDGGAAVAAATLSEGIEPVSEYCSTSGLRCCQVAQIRSMLQWCR